jgi:invasion protein IalB
MHNDLDERRRYDQRSRHQQPRYEEPDEGHQDYGDPQQDPYAGDPQGQYAEADHGQFHQGYQDPGAGYQEQPVYEDPAPRRSRLVPILSIVAAILVVAIGIGAALYFLGVFGGSGPAPAGVATSEGAPPDPPSLTDEGTAVRSVGTSTTPDAPADAASAANPDVPDAVVSIAPPAQGEPPVRSVHDAWQVRCDTPAGAQGEQCVLMQFVTAEDRENVGLTVIVLKTADQKARIMRILAPLGVLLPSGLGLKIDETDIGRAGFVRCLPNGCVAEVILEDQLLTQLQSGKTATFIIFQTPEEGIGIPISLAGFTPGFAALP